MNDICNLINLENKQDDIGNWIAKENTKQVFCEKSSVFQNEFYKAGVLGYKAELKLKLWKSDYNSETVVEFDGTRYDVYRTYINGDFIELYLKNSISNSNGNG